MCFGGKPTSPPAISAPPTPAPAPTITPSEVSAQAKNEARQKQLERLRYGLSSTIKTSGRGLVGTGAELSPTGTGKAKLGA